MINHPFSHNQEIPEEGLLLLLIKEYADKKPILESAIIRP